MKKSQNSKVTKKHTSIAVVLGFVAIIAIVGYLGSNGVGNPDQNQAAANTSRWAKKVPADQNQSCTSQISPSIFVSPLSATAALTTVPGNNNDTAAFTLRFSVRASLCPAYIYANPTWINPNGISDALYAVQRGTGTWSTITYQGVAFPALWPDQPLTAGQNGNWIVPAGTTATFTQVITVQSAYAGGAGQYRAYLKQIRWSSSDLATPNKVYTSGLGTPSTSGSFATPYVSLN